MEGKKKKILLIIVGFLIVAIALFFYLKISNQNLRKTAVIFFNVGQGDATLIKFGNGETMLVDCGPSKNILSKLGSYLPFFDRTIDYLLVTHPDGDHYGGCPSVLERYQVKNIIFDDFKKNNDPFWQAWTKFSLAENAQWKFIDHHELINIGSSSLEFLAPDNNLKIIKDADSANNHSIVFLLQNNLGKFLFTGDAEIPVEEALLSKHCPSSTPCAFLQAAYLKIGHHGSESSSSEHFLAAVAARFGIVSVGPNKYGHPSWRILRRLERANTTIWRTDLKDDIIIQ